MSDAARSNPFRFPTTRWSQLAVIRDGKTRKRCEALSDLAQRYRLPVLAFLIANTRDPVLAEDLMQDFFLWALERDFFAQAAEDRGRFRSFLLRSIQNFCISEHRKRSAEMRMPSGGFVEPTPDGALPEAVETVTPAAIFERAWLCDVIRKAIETLRRKWTAAGRETRFALLREYVIDPALEGTERPTMRELSTRYYLTPKQVELWLNSAREALKNELLREIRLYARSPEEESEELGSLFRVLEPD